MTSMRAAGEPVTSTCVARAALVDMAGRECRRVQEHYAVDDVLAAVASICGLTLDEMLGKQSDFTCRRARELAVFALRYLTMASFDKITEATRHESVKVTVNVEKRVRGQLTPLHYSVEVALFRRLKEELASMGAIEVA